MRTPETRFEQTPLGIHATSGVSHLGHYNINNLLGRDGGGALHPAPTLYKVSVLQMGRAFHYTPSFSTNFHAASVRFQA